MSNRATENENRIWLFDKVLIERRGGYSPMKIITIADSEGNQQRKEVAKQIKRWWVTNSDGTVQLTVRYGSKPLELAKGKNAIQCGSIAEVSAVLGTVKEAVMNGELDAMLETISVVGRNAKKAKASD